MEDPVICSCKQITFVAVGKAFFISRAKKTFKEHFSENADFFDAAADVEWLQGAATDLHYSVHASV